MNSEEIMTEIGNLYSPLSTECQQDFISRCKVSHLKKGEIVVREGQFSKQAYLILQGCVRAYYLKDGKDISDWFAFEHRFMASIVSFFTNEPSPHYVEFMEDSMVLEFSKDSLEELSQKYHEFEHFIRQVITETMLGLRERLYTIQFHKAEQRYEHLINTQPDITTRIPLMHIASYLGITLETLSRIRNPKNRI